MNERGIRSRETRRLYLVDAFTQTPFAGNPAGVVLDGDMLTDRQMQALAAELRCSETAFILRPNSSEAGVRLRFFTPKVEVPSCGHATVAAHYVLAWTNRLLAGAHKCETKAGLFDVDVDSVDGDYLVRIDQGEPSFAEILDDGHLSKLRTALGLQALDLVPDLPVQIVSTGHSKVIIPLKARTTLEALRPSMDALVELSHEIGCNGYFPYTLIDARVTVGRMFAPAIGIDEDPVTGNANGPLGAYLVQYGLLAVNGTKTQFRGMQGFNLGRPGSVDVMVSVQQGKPCGVAISGRAVIIYEAKLWV